jgi:hypothetical protein
MTDTSKFLTILSPTDHRSTFLPILLVWSKIPQEQGLLTLWFLCQAQFTALAECHGTQHQGRLLFNIKLKLTSKNLVEMITSIEAWVCYETLNKINVYCKIMRILISLYQLTRFKNYAIQLKHSFLFASTVFRKGGFKKLILPNPCLWFFPESSTLYI